MSAGSERAASEATSALPEATAGATGLAGPLDLDTPALLVLQEPLQANLATMRRLVTAHNDGAGARRVRLRPHFKASKTPALGFMQLTSGGAHGLCCQKLAEAEALVAAAEQPDAPLKPADLDILLTNEVVGAHKLARLRRLLQSGARLAVLVDCQRNVSDLGRLFDEHPDLPPLDILIEVNVGQDRCGVAAASPALAALLAAVQAATTARPGQLRFAGIQAYHGAIQHTRSPQAMAARVAEVARLARASVATVEGSGLSCETVTGAGTGSFELEMAEGVHTEIQPGSYIFMDVDYQRNSGPTVRHFRQSLFVLTTVMSKTAAAGRLVVDAGMKAVSHDSGPPAAFRLDGSPVSAVFVNGGDEHGILTEVPDAQLATLEVGDQLLLAPGHCDPTVNLYDSIHLIGSDGAVLATWAVTGRGPGV